MVIKKMVIKNDWLWKTGYKKCVTKVQYLMKRPVSILYIFQHYE